jgi:hypothetical protein
MYTSVRSNYYLLPNLGTTFLGKFSHDQTSVHYFSVQPCFKASLLPGCHKDPLRNIIPHYLLPDKLAP